MPLSECADVGVPGVCPAGEGVNDDAECDVPMIFHESCAGARRPIGWFAGPKTEESYASKREDLAGGGISFAGK